MYYFLGFEVVRNNKGISLSQAKYALDLLSQADMVGCKPISTPFMVGSHHSNSGASYSDATQFRSLAGALQYMTLTRPDLSYSVKSICQFMHAPIINHFQALKRILRYVKGTYHHGLQLSTDSSQTVLGYSDVDWAGCPDTRHSTTGFAIYLGSNLISWCSKKQTIGSRSSAKVEYRALASVAAKLSWTLQLLREFHVSLFSPSRLLCDNSSAIFIAYNPVSKSRSKHTDIDYYFVQELVA